MRHSWTFSTQKSKQSTSSSASSEARIVFWMFSISCHGVRGKNVFGLRSAYLALSSNIGHIFVAQFRRKHTGDITKFPAAFFRLSCKEYASGSYFL